MLPKKLLLKRSLWICSNLRPKWNNCSKLLQKEHFLQNWSLSSLGEEQMHALAAMFLGATLPTRSSPISLCSSPAVWLVWIKSCQRESQFAFLHKRHNYGTFLQVPGTPVPVPVPLPLQVPVPVPVPAATSLPLRSWILEGTLVVVSFAQKWLLQLMPTAFNLHWPELGCCTKIPGHSLWV